MDGAPEEQFMNAYNAGSGDNWRATEWEMYQVGRQVQRSSLGWVISPSITAAVKG